MLTGGLYEGLQAGSTSGHYSIVPTRKTGSKFLLRGPHVGFRAPGSNEGYTDITHGWDQKTKIFS